jgi:hypothetical protein
MIHRLRGGGIAAALVACLTGALLSGCTRTELTPAPDVVAADPQLFANGPGVALTGGVTSPDQTASGPMWWFTSPEGSLGVYNGSDQPATVRVRGSAVVPCSTPARLELSLPDGHRRVAMPAAGRPVPVRFGVQVPARGRVEVGVKIDATACQPKNDPRTLYAGLLALRARVAGTKDDDDTPPAA